MLPLSLLRAATGSPLLVELKGGDTYNGRLVSCDGWMNMNLRDVICTSRDGSQFWKMASCYIRGSAVKYLRLPPDLLEKAAAAAAAEEEQQQQQRQYYRGGRGRGRGRGGRGRGRGGEGRGGRGGRDYRGRGRGGYRGGGNREGRGRGGRGANE